MKLNPEQIEVGKQYVLVEPPFYAAIVTILADENGADSKRGHSKDWVGWSCRVDNLLEGIDPPKKIFSVGWSTEYSHYSPVFFLDKSVLNEEGFRSEGNPEVIHHANL